MTIARGLLMALCGGAIAWLFGWLKTLYYFQTFGVDLGLVAPSPWALMLESWFVVQNVMLFALLSWLALKTRERWVIGLTLVYALIPILSHYAFEFSTVRGASFLTDYRHSILKFVPFLVLALLWFGQRQHRSTLTRATWPYSQPARVIYLGVLLFWGISAAKHFGAYDANRALHQPRLHLSRITVSAGQLERSGIVDLDPASLFLLAATDRDLIVWARSAEPAVTGGAIRTILIPRDKLGSFEIQRPAQVQPGSQYF